MRFHSGGDLSLLQEALFSLTAVSYEFLEIIIAGKNLTVFELERINKYSSYICSIRPTLLVKTLNHSIGEKDGRSLLLNKSLGAARGQFLAFLDYDDVVYQKGYEMLIRELTNDPLCGLAVGGCRKSYLSPMGNWYFAEKKEAMPSNHSVLDLAVDNFIPIHSYVVDKLKVPEKEFFFSEEMDRLEDYEFVLRMSSVTQFSLNLIGFPVCEYRIRTDGSNSTIEADQSPSQEKLEAWALARARIQNTKNKYGPLLNFGQIQNASHLYQKKQTQDPMEIRYAWLLSRKMRNSKWIYGILHVLFRIFLFFRRCALFLKR